MEAGGSGVQSTEPPGGWGRGARKSPSWWPGSGEKAAPSAGGCVLRQGTETKRLPEGAVEKKDP